MHSRTTVPRDRDHSPCRGLLVRLSCSAHCYGPQCSRWYRTSTTHPLHRPLLTDHDFAVPEAEVGVVGSWFETFHGHPGIARLQPDDAAAGVHQSEAARDVPDVG